MRATAICAIFIAIITGLASAQSFSEDFFAELKNTFDESDRDDEEYLSFEWEGYDGWYNNPAHPDWGGAGIYIYLDILQYTSIKLHAKYLQICPWKGKRQ